MNKNVLDLFCGAGGLSLGFQQAGFNIIGGIEFDNTILETHKKNFPNGQNLCEDIRDIDDETVLKLFGKNVDVIIGGPPCQGFSTANMWQTDDEKIEKNRLFFEYIRFIKLLNPSVFVIENVRQILTRDDCFAKNQINEITTGLGYNVSSNILIASDYGVPQKRIRAFFVGVRNDLGITFDFNKMIKSSAPTVFEAISDLYDYKNFDQNKVLRFKDEAISDYQKLMRKRSNYLIHNHYTRFPSEKVQQRMSHVKQGENWKAIPEYLWDTQRNNRHSSAYRRLKEDQLSITIDTGHMNYFHPLFNRTPTVRESARIQSFPDDFIFEGTNTKQLIQVGNAVPPLMAQALATCIIDTVFRKGNDNEKNRI